MRTEQSTAERPRRPRFNELPPGPSPQVSWEAPDTYVPPPVRVRPLREPGHTSADATAGMPLPPEPTRVQQVVRALQKIRAQLPKSEACKEREAQALADWLRQVSFVGIDADMRDIVLRHFEIQSTKLTRRGIRAQMAWLTDNQVQALTSMLSRRSTYQELENWLNDEASLTQDVRNALYPRET